MSESDAHVADDRPPDVPVPLPIPDIEVVSRVLAGDLPAFELIMRRYNQRLFRIVRSILGDDDEAEDVVQETYVSAFEHLVQFAGHAQFSTWLTKIAIHAALARRTRRNRMQVVDMTDPQNSDLMLPTASEEVEQAAHNRELSGILTRAVDELPEDLRTVFAMRMIEGLDTHETAACLELTTANVKVRLHRARTLLRERLDERLGVTVRQLYQFGGARCDRIVATVLARLAR